MPQKDTRFKISAALFLTGQILLLLILTTHESENPVILGRLSLRMFGIIAAVIVLLLAQGIVIWKACNWLHAKWSDAALWAAQQHLLPEFIIGGGTVAFAVFFIARPIILSSAGIWLLAAGSLFLLTSVLTSVPDSRRRSYLRRSTICLAALVTVSAGLEFSARRALSYDVPYLVMEPNLHIEYHPDSELLPGIEGISTYTTNSDGMRGPEYTDGHYNILMLGNSTIDCKYLDDTETPGGRLQQQLTATSAGQPVWTGSIARDGFEAGQMVLAEKTVVPQYDIDMVIALVGAMETDAILKNPASNLLNWEQYETVALFTDPTFFSYPEKRTTYPYGLASLEMVDNLLNPADDPQVITDAGRVYTNLRASFQAADVITTIPDYSPALQQYRANLLDLIHFTSEQGVRLILVTQPAIWSPDMIPEAASLIHEGRVTVDGRAQRRSVDIMLEVLNAFNEETLAVCHEADIECIDLAGEMMGCETCFYDDWHFNEHGAQVAADVISCYLKSTEPFSD